MVQSQSCPTVCDSMDSSTPGFLVLHHLRTLLKLISIEWEKPSSRLVLCRPFFLLPAGLFQRASSWHQGASTGASASVFSVNISVRIDWVDLFAGQGTLKSLLQHHSSKASILQQSAIFMVQLSHPYMTTGKNHSLLAK